MKLKSSFDATVATEYVLWAHHTSTVIAQTRGFKAALYASIDHALSYRLRFLFEEMFNVFRVAWSCMLAFLVTLKCFLDAIFETLGAI